MTAELKPYPTMKDSGVEWLGMIPEHWEIRRAKYLFNSIDVRSENGDEELLTVSSRDGVVPRSEKTVVLCFKLHPMLDISSAGLETL